MAFPLGRRWTLLAVLLGLLLGIGLFTFHYAEGGAYLSTDPIKLISSLYLAVGGGRSNAFSIDTRPTRRSW